MVRQNNQIMIVSSTNSANKKDNSPKYSMTEFVWKRFFGFGVNRILLRLVYTFFYKHSVILGQPQYAYDFQIPTLYYDYNLLKIICLMCFHGNYNISGVNLHLPL